MDDGTKLPIGFMTISCHLIFDIKFDLTRKARYVGRGQQRYVSPSIFHSSVVSRDLVIKMFLIDTLYDLDVKMCDICDVYLNSKTIERLWFIAGND